jgi:exoribonuclease R
VLSESINSTLSLAVNMAIGNLMCRARVGLFRVMDDPAPRAIVSLRRTAEAIGIHWLHTESLRDLQRRMDPENQSHQRFLLEARRAGGRASYAIFNESKPPWHGAIGAIYAHATAPMRRLGDRYVLDLASHLFKREPVPALLAIRIAMMPEIMQRSESRSSAVERAVIDLLEAVSLQGRIGEVLDAEVVDAAAGIVQTTDSAIRAKATTLKNAVDGEKVKVRIDAANPKTRTVKLVAI